MQEHFGGILLVGGASLRGGIRAAGRRELHHGYLLSHSQRVPGRQLFHNLENRSSRPFPATINPVPGILPFSEENKHAPPGSLQGKDNKDRPFVFYCVSAEYAQDAVGADVPWKFRKV